VRSQTTVKGDAAIIARAVIPYVLSGMDAFVIEIIDNKLVLCGDLLDIR